MRRPVGRPLHTPARPSRSLRASWGLHARWKLKTALGRHDRLPRRPTYGLRAELVHSSGGRLKHAARLSQTPEASFSIHAVSTVAGGAAAIVRRAGWLTGLVPPGSQGFPEPRPLPPREQRRRAAGVEPLPRECCCFSKPNLLAASLKPIAFGACVRGQQGSHLRPCGCENIMAPRLLGGRPAAPRPERPWPSRPGRGPPPLGAWTSGQHGSNLRPLPCKTDPLPRGCGALSGPPQAGHRPGRPWQPAAPAA
jgi:hypothetical protein